jgi:hypothetical protein
MTRGYLGAKWDSPKQMLTWYAIAIMVGILAGLWCNSAFAHDQWADNTPVPSWVKASCCGAADAHHLRPEQVHDYGDWYEVDGYYGNGGKIPHRVALPSQDGDYWIFYAEGGAGRYGGAGSGQSGVYCFFVPMAF